MWVQLTYELSWKDNIIKQAKDQETMTAARVNVMLIQTADVTIEANDTVHSQNVELCELSYDNDSDNTDKEYINSDSCDSLNVLAALMKTCEKQKANTKDKNKQVMQDCVKKK